MRGLALLAIAFLVIIAMAPVVRAWRARVSRETPPRRDELVKDPVCQTYVLLSRAVTTEDDGIVTHFCSRECAARFARGERRA
jgi:YHS domain-containing protein